MAQNAQKATKGAAEQFNRFVEGEGGTSSSSRTIEPEKKDFWDSFGAPGEPTKKSSTIGTAAMKGGGAGGGGLEGKGTGGGKGEDGWEEW